MSVVGCGERRFQHAANDNKESDRVALRDFKFPVFLLLILFQVHSAMVMHCQTAKELKLHSFSCLRIITHLPSHIRIRRKIMFEYGLISTSHIS